MRLILILIAMLANAVSAQEDDRDTLRHLKERLWPKAYREADVDLLDSILHEDFAIITASGDWSTRERELAELPAYDWPHESFSYQIRRLDIYHDNTAIVAGEGRASGKNNEGPYCLVYQSSNVLIKQEGEWKAVLSHVSGVTTDCDS